MVLDTETVLINGIQAVYDIAYAITDNSGIAVKSVNVLIYEIYNGYNKAFQHDAYDGQNIKARRKQYNKMLESGTISIMTFNDFISEFNTDMERYKIDKPAAYNCTFDCNALSKTAELLNIMNHPFKISIDGKTKEYPMGDLYIPCKTLLQNDKKYAKWCEKYGFITPKGKIKYTAESVYAYLTKNPGHIEKHYALSDVTEESFIYTFLRRKKIKIDKKVVNT